MSATTDIMKLQQLVCLVIQYFEMISAEEKKCNQCLQRFQSSRLPLKMPVCKHNICDPCVKQIKQSKIDTVQCQFCNTSINKIQKKSFEPNRLLIIKLKQTNQFIQNDLKQNQTNNSFLKQPPKPHQTDLLLTQQDGQKEANNNQKKEEQKYSVKLKQTPNNSSQICQQHQKHLQIICINDLKMICPHCAIFGNHKDHNFKTLKQFIKDCQLNYQKLQMIKQQKYMFDKKVKLMKDKSSIQNLISSKKALLRKQVDAKFKKVIEQINNLQEKICQEVNKGFSLAYQQIINITQQQNKLQTEYSKWQSEYQNSLDQIQKSLNIQQKIKILYGNLIKMDNGQQYIEKLQKKIQIQSRKIEDILNSVSFQFKDGLDLSKYFKVSKKQLQQLKKDNFEQMLQKLSLPVGKHIMQDVTGLDQNSFVSDFSKQDFSMILEGETRRIPTKSVMSKRNTNIATKYASPSKKVDQNPTEKLIRAKSNTNLKIPELRKTKIESSKMIETTLQKTLQIRDPQVIIADFIKHDLKQVLDLSRCQLKDESAIMYLKQVRKHRKIRGLKLCQNQITDSGFQKIIQFLGSTSNLNMSYNNLTEDALSIIINNRDQISPLRIVNFSGNNLNQKKSKTRIDTLKKMGIIINL